MNLKAKKELAARALNVGKQRITFVNERMDEIKEAITKQDMRDLFNEKAIKIKEVSGRKSKPKWHKKRSAGNIRKKVNVRKRDYVIMTRKLRRYVHDLREKGEISPEEVKELRKKIRNKSFKSKAHMRENTEQRNKGIVSKEKPKKNVKTKVKSARSKK